MNSGGAGCGTNTGSGGANHERYFAILPSTSSRSITLDTCGSTIDTVVYVRSGVGSCSAGTTSVACSDDVPGACTGSFNRESQLTFTAAANTTCYVLVDQGPAANADGMAAGSCGGFTVTLHGL